MNSQLTKLGVNFTVKEEPTKDNPIPYAIVRWDGGIHPVKKTPRKFCSSPLTRAEAVKDLVTKKAALNPEVEMHACGGFL